MSTKGLAAALVAALVAIVGAPLPGAAQGATDTGSRLWIEGTSTVRSWTCQVPNVEPIVRLDPSHPGAPAPGLPNGIASVTVTIPVMAIECGNGKMNEHLRKALKVDQSPEIRYELRHYTPEGGSAATVGEVTVAGQARPLEMNVTLTALPGGGARVQGDQAITMTDFGVKPPSLMLGTLKVGPVVHVKFDVVVQSQTAVATN